MKKLLLFILVFLPFQTFASGGHGEGVVFILSLAVGLAFILVFGLWIFFSITSHNQSKKEYHGNSNSELPVSLGKRIKDTFLYVMFLFSLAFICTGIVTSMPGAEILGVFTFPVFIIILWFFLRKMNFFK